MKPLRALAFLIACTAIACGAQASHATVASTPSQPIASEAAPPASQSASAEPAPSESAMFGDASAPSATASVAPPASTEPPASPALTIQGPDGTTLRCNEQTPQPFLVRGNWFKGDPKAGQKMLQDAIKYRTQQYGYFQGFGQPSWNAHPPRYYAKSTTFFGMGIQINERIIPALKCVEAALKAANLDAAYHPQSIGGIRFTNTYRGYEVSNHVYGIAIDIEPSRNTCCGCVKPWTDHPLCQNRKLTVWQRMAMPKSWVDTFEKYGFYWLGHDVLQDTMHFEFLGDPDKITDSSAQPVN